MIMKKALLWLLILALLLPCAGLAQDSGVSCLQGDIVEVELLIAEDYDMTGTATGSSTGSGAEN